MKKKQLIKPKIMALMKRMSRSNTKAEEGQSPIARAFSLRIERVGSLIIQPQTQNIERMQRTQRITKQDKGKQYVDIGWKPSPI